MGQAHPRSIELEASISTGPDPTLFHPAAVSTPMQTIGTDQTFSRIVYTPGGSLPPSITTASRGKSLVRKISQKAKCRGNTKTKHDIEAFEQLVLEKEAKAGILPSEKEAKVGLLPIEKDTRVGLLACESPTVRTAKAGTFAATRAKRASISDGSSSVPFPAGMSTSTPLPYRPTSKIIATANIHRRDSGRISIKSARRAEREWRAKVAALGHTANSTRGSSVVEVRGPVPPRRKAPVHRPVSPASVPQPVSPASLPQLASPTSIAQPASPASDYILTPHVSPAIATDLADTTTARSFVSNMSFETLGHLADTTPTRLEDGPRSRKVSVPQSVTSFYFDPHSRGGTRPSSFATTLSLAPIPQESGDITETSPRDRKISLPPFDSFLVSPANVGNSPANSPVLVSRALEDTDENASGSRYRPNIKPIIPTPFELAGDQVSSPTPYSPVTAYLLTAPIDQLSLDSSSTSVTPRHPEHARHPFADASLALPPHHASLAFPRHSSQPPTPPPKSQVSTICQRHDVTRSACARYHPDTSYDPFTPTPLRTSSRSRAKAMHTDSLPAALRAGKIPAKAQVRVKVDLTPGMETGNRPPKSGMGVGDLERWLQQTTLTA
ncbi:hypothetical protein BCR39DRAFT_555521 [Naematelia encephala]|uniref:Uncharacterized protein n=1 Tax=Naematelia encephala TaxID=71784 RepID=A0A1Y2BKS2_9TREE|nr:hypothetical protein BCR39DRAFT_555521 [Naematelia encephala]